jgi:hypothetical protein
LELLDYFPNISSLIKNWGGSSYGAFTLDVKSMLNENIGGILGGSQC